jgi:hypothetical protein
MAGHATIGLDSKKIAGDIPAPDKSSRSLKTLAAGTANRPQKLLPAFAAVGSGGNCEEQPLKTLVGISGADLGRG